MPIYEYRCHGCHDEFEKLVFSMSSPICCPGCGGDDVERRPSVFGMSGVEKQTSSASGCSGCSASSCSGCGSR